MDIPFHRKYIIGNFMNTKWLMIASAFILAGTGILLTFMPAEIATLFTHQAVAGMEVILQLMGALFFAFAMLNWMAKGAIIGGIYNRPISIANFTHFFIGAMALIKAILKYPDQKMTILSCTVIYSILALLFGILLFRHPGGRENKTG